MSRFNLTLDQMNAFLGGQSVMVKAIQAIQGTLQHSLQCPGLPCELKVLFYKQFFQGSWTSVPFPVY